MTDLLAHFVDAPLPNIFILAGLIFLGIGILGKVSAEIEPGTAGRVMSAVLGVLLLTFGVYAHLRADTNQQSNQTSEQAGTDHGSPKEPNPPATENVLSGEWVNDRSTSHGMAKLRVKQNGGVVTVHAWQVCSPKDCDWGEANGRVTDYSASVTWDQGSVLRKMTIAADKGRLKVIVESVYRDNRPAQHLQEYFVRS